jgi:hypothetical protein
MLGIAFFFSSHCRPKEGVKISATDDETKSEAMAPPPNIDAQA